MAPRKKKTVQKKKAVQSDTDSDWSLASYAPSDKDIPRAPNASSSIASYSLRDHSQIKRPERYRGGHTRDPTRPLWVHPRPAFNHELAKFIPWNTISPDHKGPIPSEMAYERHVAERERERELERERERERENNPDNAPDNQDIDVVFQPRQKDGESSTGPFVAHLRRKSPKQDPLKYVYTADPSIVDKTKFHPPSDQYSYHDEYNPDLSLEGPGEDANEEQLELERRKAAYVDWNSLSDGVKFAVVYDLVQDYGFTGTTQVLNLSVDEVISFKKLYRREKAKWDAFEARIAGEVRDATARTRNQCARPLPRADPNAPPAPELRLVTDSLGKEEVEKGRRFLKFLGMDNYANVFNKWYGSNDRFYEMPEVLDLYLDFLEDSTYRYPGFDISFPPTKVEPELQNEGNNQGSHSPLRFPPSPGMPDPMAGVHWPPIIDESFNPEDMELARRAFRGIRDPLNPSEGPENRHGSKRDWDAPGLGLGLVIFDAEERIRLQTAEELRRKMNPGGVAINGNDEERAFNMRTAGYRLATVEDLAPPAKSSTGFQIRSDPSDSVPYDDPAALYNQDECPAELFEEVMESDFLTDFALDPPVPNNGNGDTAEKHDGRDAGHTANAANIASQSPVAPEFMSRSALMSLDPAPIANHDEQTFEPGLFVPASGSDNDVDYDI